MPRLQHRAKPSFVPPWRQSDFDVAAGLIASLEDVLAEPDGVANEIEARRRVRTA